MMLRRFLILLVFTLLSSCSWLEPINPFSSEKAVGDLSSAEAALAASEEQETTRSVIEVLWQVPGEPVDFYLIDYGFAEDNLDRQLKIPVLELTKIDHPKHGPVFRYELRGAPSDRDVYLSLRAENKFGISAASRIVKIEPGQQSVLP